MRNLVQGQRISYRASIYANSRIETGTVQRLSTSHLYVRVRNDQRNRVETVPTSRVIGLLEGE